METFKIKTFDIPELNGISEKNIEEHLKLYKGYVSNANLVLNKIKEYEQNPAENAYILSEINRRFAFEFGGVRNHEIYFSSLSGGSKSLPTGSKLLEALEKEGETFDSWLEKFKALAMTRGVGWAMLYYEKESGKIINHWVDEQHIGHLVGLSPILALDMWEHAFVYDYGTSEKKKYVEAFFANLNWEVIENNFKSVI